MHGLRLLSRSIPGQPAGGLPADARRTRLRRPRSDDTQCPATCGADLCPRLPLTYSADRSMLVSTARHASLGAARLRFHAALHLLKEQAYEDNCDAAAGDRAEHGRHGPRHTASAR
ncbi:hypothetical protein XAP412_1190004 [Xanthomonas phaseoli pv. phaseoli]|uniref:Uncharacterized protein n=1 Tax=Xanthomonas campestris pv. phaseoli TaxID=317013 RepID=A0AB38DV64_XANCH|nr:hypothetical protein XAP6984_1230004 [Xanthomonas phaseoli pv. phaseoli]SON76890.1 hypothetical protein XAP412_1190004 [Xanthomonas phaseoli pv. phaseoli]SON81824.1 hypothetical protein XAP7430_1200004 [Xanthomonas phaseoli pv. phaseoli]SOO31043.1 hypothetical protein XAP6164_4960004 [Xanthomonas phaseoli pv. phaseoli]